MILDKNNVDIINSKTVHLHDGIALSILFDRSVNTASLMVLLPTDKLQLVNIVFNNIIGMSVTNCAYWGRSERISCWYAEVGVNRSLIRNLFDEKNTENYPLCPLKDEDDYVETVIEFISGDSFRIACEYISFDVLPG